MAKKDPASPSPAPRRCRGGEAQSVQGPAVAAGLPDKEPESWLPPEEAPFGVPVQIRGGPDGRTIAVRDQYAPGGWFNSERSGPLRFTPDGWARME